MDHLLSGIVDDPRAPEAKKLDYATEEVMTLPPPPWREKRPEEWRKFPVRNQNGSGMCVAQTGAKLLGIDNLLEEPTVPFQVFSALDIYDRRQNKPDAGMWGMDALSICSKFGATLDNIMPSQNLSEAQANLPVIRSAEGQAIAEKYKAGGYAFLPENVDSIASFIAQTGKGAMIFVSFEYDEWNDVPKVIQDSGHLRHSITAVDYTVWEGEKALVIDDSWGNFNVWNGQRVVKESFLKARLFFAGNLLNLDNNRKPVDPEPDRPRYHWKDIHRVIHYGEQSADVVALQQVLKYMQLFPQAQKCTGIYSNITAKGVYALQTKYHLANQSILDGLQGVRSQVGPATLKFLTMSF